jgi:spore maturation protein CgeB
MKMRLLKITTCYPDYLRCFYLRNPGLADQPFVRQKAALDYDAFGWADYWSQALVPLGYEVMEVTWNAEPLQRAWFREHFPDCPGRIDPGVIAIEQAKQFKPEILWFDESNEDLLTRIRMEIPSLRLVLGWAGSAVPRTNAWRHMDLILSCAPESVDSLQRAGYPASHLHHGFDPRINSRLEDRSKRFNFSFIGQMIRENQYHRNREQLLEQLASSNGIDIFSPSANLGWTDCVKARLMGWAYEWGRTMKTIGFSDRTLESLPVVGQAARMLSKPASPVNPRLKRLIKPAVYGLEMFQVLRDTRVVLNIHADSSPFFASNMRLFETTGVGTCLLTDWKDNLCELFDPEKEVVTYRTPEECAEKARWLLDNPTDREKIAMAGQSRTLREHTFTRRAFQLDTLIGKALK